MTHYQEIFLLPNADIGLYFLWQKVYQQIHLALVEHKEGANRSAVGLSFPGYDAGKYLLGTRLRLFAAEEKQLQQVNCVKWLHRLDDYVDVNRITPVPAKRNRLRLFQTCKA